MKKESVWLSLYPGFDGRDEEFHVGKMGFEVWGGWCSGGFVIRIYPYLKSILDHPAKVFWENARVQEIFVEPANYLLVLGGFELSEQAEGKHGIEHTIIDAVGRHSVPQMLNAVLRVRNALVRLLEPEQNKVFAFFRLYHA